MYDVEVRGAGPAGSYAANALARKGYSVHLVDCADFPRDKLCGGGLSRKSLDLIESLEPSFGSTGLAEFVRELDLVSPDLTECRTAHLAGDVLALVHRRSFDAWWLGRALDAGAEFSHAPSEARHIIAADGVTSSLGKSIRGPFRGDEVAVATETVSPQARGPFVALVFPPAQPRSAWGYSWAFGRSDGVALGTGIRRDQEAALPALQERIRQVARRFGIQDYPRFSHWVIPLYRPRPAARGNVALVGDALGTADPLLVEGIASGMTSAKILVQSFDRNQDFSRYTPDLSRHPYFRSMRYLDLIQRLGAADLPRAYAEVRGPYLMERFVRLLRSPSSARSLVAVLAARHPILAMRAWKQFDLLPTDPLVTAGPAAA